MPMMPSIISISFHAIKKLVVIISYHDIMLLVKHSHNVVVEPPGVPQLHYGWLGIQYSMFNASLHIMTNAMLGETC